MIVIEDLSFNDEVMVLSSELASSELSEIVVESFTHYKDVCALSNWSHVWIHGSDTIRRH